MIGFFWLTILDAKLIILKKPIGFADPLISRLKANCIEENDFKLQLKLSTFCKSSKTFELQKNSIFY